MATRNERSVPLDVLRGVAVLLVVFHHTQIDPTKTGLSRPVFFLLSALGGTGVDLFFVLSGFLIGGLLFKELAENGGIDVWRFLIRRGFKIWPGYLLLVGFAFLQLLHHGAPWRHALSTVAPNLLQYQNYHGYVIGHTWSIAVEEHFYLLLPALLILIARGASRSGMSARMSVILWIAALLSALCLGLRCWRVMSGSRINPLGATEIRIDALFFGVALAYVYHLRPRLLVPLAEQPWVLFLICFVLLAAKCVFNSERFYHTFGFTICFTAYGALLLGFVLSDARAATFRRVVNSWPGRACGYVGF